MSNTEQLRNLPAVDEVQRQHEIVLAVENIPPRHVVEWIRRAIDRCRQSILSGEQHASTASMSVIVEDVLRQLQIENSGRQQTVINATGILLHTNLGRAPLAMRAVERMSESAGYANVELDLQSGKRSGRGERVCRLLQELTGAEDVVVVNNCAAATMLVLQTVAANRDVVVSRGQLVEIGGGFRLPEVFAASGAVLKEVGTTNRTYLRDYEAVLSDDTGAIIRVHRSNFYQGGFVTEPDIAELVSLGRQHNVCVIDDVGSGCMTDLSRFGLAEPMVYDSIRAGADLTLFSGDKLFGGPQAGIIAGRSELVGKIRRNPMMRALRVDKVTLAGIEATAEIHLSGKAFDELPLFQMLASGDDVIRQNCDDIASRLNVPAGITCDVVACTSQIGGGSVPGSQIASYGLRFASIDSEQFSRELRCSPNAVLGRIQDDSVVLDLRTVDHSHLAAMTTAIQRALDSVSGDGA